MNQNLVSKKSGDRWSVMQLEPSEDSSALLNWSSSNRSCIEKPIDATGTFARRLSTRRAFDQESLWDRMARRGHLLPAHIDELAGQPCRFHRDCAVADPHGPAGQPAQLRAPVLDNLAALDDACVADHDQALLHGLREWEAATFASLESVFTARLREGRVCDVHGDLHLGNVACTDGHTTVFDCIDFNAAFRWIDVMSEIAFMAMDLHSHGMPLLAHRFVDAYLACTGDYGGVRVLRYYVVHRALVRAKVGALRAVQVQLRGLGHAVSIAPL